MKETSPYSLAEVSENEEQIAFRQKIIHALDEGEIGIAQAVLAIGEQSTDNTFQPIENEKFTFDESSDEFPFQFIAPMMYRGEKEYVIGAGNSKSEAVVDGLIRAANFNRELYNVTVREEKIDFGDFTGIDIRFNHPNGTSWNSRIFEEKSTTSEDVLIVRAALDGVHAGISILDYISKSQNQIT